MNITLINASDKTGGAAVACKRLLDAFNENGINAGLLVQEKKTDDPKVIECGNRKMTQLRFAAEYLWFNKFEKAHSASNAFSAARLGQNIHERFSITSADVINLHWINNSFINLNGLNRIMSLNKPIVWHLHDMWAFTGGCHYSAGCLNFQKECGNCPYLKKGAANDLSHLVWKKKSAGYKKAKITFVAASEWLAKVARTSSLCQGHEVLNIPNPINTELYKPVEKHTARKMLNLDPDKRYILFGAMNISDKRKGFQYFKEAVNSGIIDNSCELLVFGKMEEEVTQSLSLKVNQLGFINNEQQMIFVYNAADVYVIPSLEDNLPNTVMESLSCGTPVVGFNTGGIPEMVNHLNNGFIASQGNAGQLAEGIKYILSSPEYTEMAEAARAKVLNDYSNKIVSGKYKQLFERILRK